jgi:hypothetical protein
MSAKYTYLIPFSIAECAHKNVRGAMMDAMVEQKGV